MPRGPFQGTFQPNLRPTVVTGPDAIVYINGESDVIGCPSCRKKFDLNSFVTSITVDLNVDSPPGSASIALSIPRHAVDDFYFEGNALITPMMEVEIFAKGYYLVEGVPQYYPIFWGLVTEVGNSYSGGEHTVSISCSDILKWWELCKMNINPAFTASAGQQGRSIFGNVFFGMNPFDVIWSCAQQAFGDVVVGSGSLVSLVKENGGQKQVFTEALGDIMAYWESRFSRTRGNLLLYGTNGIAVRGDSLFEAWNVQKKGKFKEPFASAAVRKANGGKDSGQMVFDPTDPSVVAFRTQFSQAGQVNFWSSEFQTKLELANAAKEAIGYEFFMDVTGDLVFKPPFFNLDILSNKPISWIQDIDVIDWDFSESEAEVVTQLTMQGSFGGNVDYGFPEDITPFTSVTDYHLLRKYGWRTHTVNSEFMGDTLLMFYHGMDILDRINSKRHRGSVTIPMRPELRLGFPIYVAPLDQVWYVTGISHNCAFGSRATTTLTLTAKRQKFFAPRGIGTIRLKKYNGPAAAAVKSAKPDPKAKDAKDGKQKAEPVPDPILPFKYTARQISKYAEFKVNLGEGATLPASISQIESSGKSSGYGSTNPYAPLILRHPKTGRAVGYPNVNMIYTRPFAPPKEELAKAGGQKPAGQAKFQDKNAEKKLKDNLDGLRDRLAKKNAYSTVDAARDTLLNNRYQYGLNSAGVFVYVYDMDQIFGEVTFVPAKNIGVQYQGADVAVKLIEGKDPKTTGMVRPVSDERGFEVVGHFRYGRGLAIRDGRLVYNPNQKNQAASVGIQTALAGDLFSTLTAQSQGLTSLTSIYANPIDAITRLAPDGSDLQTAGTQNEPTAGQFANAYIPVSKDGVAPDGSKFADTAPLGSAEQKGQIASVEASQLSRALTIAELNVIKKGGSQDTQCGCLAGRADLAFMNQGYQLKPLNVNTMGGVAPATGTLPGKQIGGNTDIQNASGDLAGPVTDEQYRSALGGANVLTKIDSFLFDLYKALDQPHQELEAALRGETLNIAFPTTEEMRFGKPGSTTSELSPPFNPANRLAVGDPAAIAAQANSAKADLKKTWSDFGKNLKKNTDKAQLQGEINLASKQLGEVNAKIQALQKQQASVDAGNAKIVDFTGKSIQQQIEEAQKEAAKLQQEIKNKTLQLQQLG